MSKAIKLDKRGRFVLDEADVTAQIIGRLTADGWTCIKLDVGVNALSGLPFGELGMCDWWVGKAAKVTAGYPRVPPETLFIELKRPGEKPDRHQYAWMSAMQNRGFNCMWFDSYADTDGGKRPFLNYYFGGWFRL